MQDLLYQSSTGNYSVQDLQYKVVTVRCTRCVKHECPTSSALQECFRVLSESVLPDVCKQECPTRVSYKSVPQECHARVSHTIVTRRVSKQECSEKSGFLSAFCKHLLFVFHCCVGTLLLLRELLKNAFGFVVSIRFCFLWQTTCLVCSHKIQYVCRIILVYGILQYWAH